jgi:phosphatidylserine/phosphatidylglycerophosphate/cardiolipin synthase-like enzyme
MFAGERLVLDPSERYQTLVDAVNAARQSLDLSVFRCDDPFIIELLELARARGVHVRVLLTNRAKGGRKQLAWLEAVLGRSGIQVSRYDGTCHKYHAKYVLIDGRRTLVSSMNLTREHIADTDDVLFASSDPSIHDALARMFERDWRGDATPVASCDRLIVSPDNARRRLGSLIAGARRSIVVADHKLTDLSLLHQLLTAQARGVAVQLITDPMRFGLRAHGKAMVIDDRLAVVGSLALSADTLDRRRDLAVVVTDPVLVRTMADQLRPWHRPSRARRAREMSPVA